MTTSRSSMVSKTASFYFLAIVGSAITANANNGAIKLTGSGRGRTSSPLAISESFQAGFCFDQPIFAVNESILIQSLSTPAPTAAPPVYIWRFFDAFGSRHLKFEQVNQTAVQICIKEPVNVEEYRTTKITKVTFGVAAAHQPDSSGGFMATQLHFFNHSISPIWLINVNDLPPKFVDLSSLISRVEEGNYDNYCLTRFRVVDEDFSSITVELKVVLKSISPPIGVSSSPNFRVSCNSTNNQQDSSVTAMNCCLLVSGMLDFELVQSHIIELEASDGASQFGQPTLSDKIELVVVVMDVDDTPPIFSAPMYTATIAEDTKAGSEILTVSARDGDARIANQVAYSIISVKGGESLLSYFTIDPKSGVIRLAKPIDREANDIRQLVNAEIKLEVEAREVKKSTSTKTLSYNASTVASVIITVADVDDNDPIFSARIYSLTAVWTQAAGVWTIVSSDGNNIRVTDLDESSNAAFRLSIKSNDDSPVLFNVVPPVATGSTLVELLPTDNDTLLQTLSGSTWSAEIKAEAVFPNNRGQRRFSTATVNIAIQPANTEAPRFEKKSYNFDVNENSEPGTFVGKLSASDTDPDRYGVVTYSITTSNVAAATSENDDDNKALEIPFELDPLTGVLTVSVGFGRQALDRETTAEYLLFVSAVDGGGLSDSAVVRIRLIDVNDNGPSFLSSSCSAASIPEETLGVVPNCVFLIHDPDAAPNNESVIKISSVNLLLNVASTSDIPDQSSSKIPVISKDIFRLTRHYDSADTSSGGAKWVLSLVSSVDVDKLRTNLPVDGSSGGVTIMIGLRAEDTNAAQNHQLGNFADSTLRLTFTDINDNAPECNNLAADGSTRGGLYVEVFENVTSEDVAAKLLAFDNDEPRTPNSMIVYSWTSSEQQSTNYQANPFSIDPESGEIRLSPGQSLDKDTVAFYNFSVRLQDLGNPPQNTTCLVSIRVIDVNNKPPRFTPSSSKYVSVVENSAPEKFLAVMSAEDPDVDANLEYILLSDMVTADFGPNWLETMPSGTSTKNMSSSSHLSIGEYQNDSLYSPLPGGSTMALTPPPPISSMSPLLASMVSKMFSVDKRNGFVHLLEKLDREMLHVVKLPIMVRDLNAASQSPAQIATGTLVIQIIDMNDESPRFDRSDNYYMFEVHESTPIASKIGTVKCIDSDSDDATFIQVEPWGDRHIIDVTPLGDVIIKQSLDFETQRLLNVTVLCTDQASHRAKAIVAISLIDDNDCAPVFANSLSEDAYAVVSESATIGQSVLKMHATDCDSGDYGTLNYFIVAGNEKSHFSINTYTGEVVVSGHLDAEQTDNYDLTILVKDNPTAVMPNQTNKSTRRLHIAVSDSNDCAPTFVNHTVWLGEVSIDSLRPGDILQGTPLATDCDKTANNSIIKYSIPGYGGGPNIFIVEASTGRVRVGTNVSRELLASALGNVYSFELKASDNGKPKKLSNVAIVSLKITDPNNKYVPTAVEALLKTASRKYDHSSEEAQGTTSTPTPAIPTVLRDRSFYFRVNEESKDCFGRIELQSDFEVCCGGMNYVIKGSTPYNGNLVAREVVIESDDGNRIRGFELCVLETFDREMMEANASISFNVSMQGSSKCPSTSCLEDVAISLEVVDINDNSPKFQSAKLVGRGLSPLVKDNQVVINLKEYLTDRDFNEDFSTVRFAMSTIDTDRHQYFVFQRFFTLNESSGVITSLPSPKRAPLSFANTGNSMKVIVTVADTTISGTTSETQLIIPVVKELAELVDIVVRLPVEFVPKGFSPKSQANILPESEEDRITARNFTETLNKALSNSNSPIRINEASQTMRLHPLYSDQHMLHIIVHEIDAADEKPGAAARSSSNVRRKAVNTDGQLYFDYDVSNDSLATALGNAYHASIAVANVFKDFPVIHIYPFENVTQNSSNSDVIALLASLVAGKTLPPDVIVIEQQQSIRSEQTFDGNDSDESFSTYMSWAFLSIVIVSFLTMSILILVAAFVVFRQKYHRKMRALEILLTADPQCAHRGNNNNHQKRSGMTTISSTGASSTRETHQGNPQYFDSRTLPAILKASNTAESGILSSSSNGHLHKSNNASDSNSNHLGDSQNGITRVHYAKASAGSSSQYHHNNSHVQQPSSVITGSSSDHRLNSLNGNTGLLDNFRTNSLFTTFLRPVTADRLSDEDESRERKKKPQPSQFEQRQQQQHEIRRLFTFSDDSGTGRGGAGAGAGATVGGVPRSRTSGSIFRRAAQTDPNRRGAAASAGDEDAGDDSEDQQQPTAFVNSASTGDEGFSSIASLPHSASNSHFAESKKMAVVDATTSSASFIRQPHHHNIYHEHGDEDFIDNAGGEFDDTGAVVAYESLHSSNADNLEPEYCPIETYSKLPFIDSTVHSATSSGFTSFANNRTSTFGYHHHPPNHQNGGNKVLSTPPYSSSNHSSNGKYHSLMNTSNANSSVSSAGFVYTMNVHFAGSSGALSSSNSNNGDQGSNSNYPTITTSRIVNLDDDILCADTSNHCNYNSQRQSIAHLAAQSRITAPINDNMMDDGSPVPTAGFHVSSSHPMSPSPSALVISATLL